MENENCILNLLRAIIISTAAVHCCATSVLIFGCVVGVNPAPTTPSRSSLPCIAPWQIYCTSFLGHDLLHSGCFPSVFVVESEGPSLLQRFIPLSDRYSGDGIKRRVKVVREFALLTPCSQIVGTIQKSVWTRWIVGTHITLRAWSTCIYRGSALVMCFRRQTALWCLLHCHHAGTWSPRCAWFFSPFVPFMMAKCGNLVKHTQETSPLFVFSFSFKNASIVPSLWRVSSCHTGLLPSPPLRPAVGPRGAYDLLTPQYGNLWCHFWF